MSFSYMNMRLIKFVRRQTILVAYTFARAANTYTSFHKLEIIPLYIKHLSVNDMN
jgi:hypothetical protein